MILTPINIRTDGSEKVKYDFSDFPVYIRRSLLSLFPNYTANSHWHDDIELIAVISGHMMYNVNGQILRINEGEGILINSRQFHFGFSDDKTECDYICVLFHPMILCTTSLIERDYITPVLESKTDFVLFQKEDNRYMGCFEEIFNISENVNSPIKIITSLFGIWDKVYHNITETEASSDASRITLLKKMISFIQENYKEKFTLEDIANSGNVSKRTCGNLFLKYLNQTPISYLTDFRLRKSIELMRKTDMTIIEISLSVGFSGASYYAECFREQFGMSPTEYKKLMK